MKTGPKTRLGPEDRALFDAAREGFAPTEGDRARIARTLGLGVGVGTGVASATAKAGAASVATSPAALGVSSGIVAAKWVAVVALVIGVGVGTGEMALRRERTAPFPSPSAAVSAGAESARESAVSRSPGAVPTQVAGEETAAVTPRALPLPGSPVFTTESPKPMDADASRARRGASSASPVGARPVAVPPSDPSSASVKVAPAASSAEAPPSGTAAASSVRVGEEAQLLREADAALRAGDTAGAARLLDDHARLFPQGVLAEERDFQRVVLLCAAGKADAARRAASRFLSAYPQSVFAGRVRASCGGE